MIDTLHKVGTEGPTSVIIKAIYNKREGRREVKLRSCVRLLATP